MNDYLRLIDTETSGPRCDVTPLFADPDAFASLVSDLAEPFRVVPIDYVVGIDALGFVLGTAIALELRRGFIPLRKGGKLPVPATSREFTDYSGTTKTLEMRDGSVRNGDRVLIVDEWIETGAQVSAAIELIERVGGIVAGIATINVDGNAVTQRLTNAYRLQAIWHNMEATGE